MVNNPPFINGPFVVLVEEPDGPEAIAQVISPAGGFPTRESAVEFCDLYRPRGLGRGAFDRPPLGPYLGCKFTILNLSTPEQFMIYCSWED